MIKRLLQLLVPALLFTHLAFAAKRTENTWSALATTSIFYGKFDRYDVFFNIPAKSIKHAGTSTSFGFEYLLKNGFGVRPQLGYQRTFYSSIGIQQMTKNFLVTDLLFSYYPLSNPKRLDPYIVSGPSIIFSKSGDQAYLKTGVGTQYKLNSKWALRLEALSSTDFTGVRGSVGVGVNYRF